MTCHQTITASFDAILQEQRQMHDNARQYTDDPTLVRNIIADGCERARDTAEDTLEEVRASVGLDYY